MANEIKGHCVSLRKTSWFMKSINFSLPSEHMITMRPAFYIQKGLSTKKA